MTNTVMHLRLDSLNNDPRLQDNYRPGELVTVCGHYAWPDHCTDDHKLVTCKLCKRTLSFKIKVRRT